MEGGHWERGVKKGKGNVSGFTINAHKERKHDLFMLSKF